MKFFDRFRFAARMASEPPGYTFSSVPKPIDTAVQAFASSTTHVTRDQALSIPAVLRGRNLICVIATLPLEMRGPDLRVMPSPLFSQIDSQVPNVVTLAQTVEDLLFEGVSWWQIKAFGWDGFPNEAQHLDVCTVSTTPPTDWRGRLLPSGIHPDSVIWVNGEPVDGKTIIRFDSPNPPILTAGARAIRRALKLDTTAERYADNPRPMDYFTPGEGADPADDGDIAEILAQWNASRLLGSTAYVPASLQYNSVQQPTPADLQLVQLQQRAALDIANLIGLDPEDLGVSTTSRTYQNATDRRQDKINDVLAAYMRAVTDRLSMNDVTKRGYAVAFDLDDYMKADPITRWSVYQTASGLNAITTDEIRSEEGMPALPPGAAPKPAAPTLAPQGGTPVLNSGPVPVSFSSDPETFTVSFSTEDFAADTATRTVSGVLIPFGAVGQTQGRRWRFTPGSIEWQKSAVSKVKLNREHDRASLLGAATVLSESASGVTARFKVGRGPLADQALHDAEDNILDGFSAELNIMDYTTDPTDPSVNLVKKARLTGAALTGSPAFDDARLTSVAASATSGTETDMPDTPEQAAPAAAPADFAAFLSAWQAQRETPAPAPAPAETREVVNPARKAAFSVAEPLPYRFNGRRGQYDFSTDLFASARDSSGEAAQRVQQFMEVAFADVSTDDVNELNPNKNRPDLYVDNLSYQYPMWDAVNKGSIPDATPFYVPKFSSAGTLVGAHSESNEPTGGTYVTTSQTVTPGALSGVVEITRETLDQGGNPQVSTLIWNEMQRAWFEALEAKVVTALDALSPTGITLTTGAVDADLEASLTSQLAALQYIRGGNRFRDFFVQIDLYKALVGAVDDTGRKLFPILAPQNASGTTDGFFADLMVGGLRARPAWALAATGAVAASSYLFNRDDVSGWATAPQRLNFEWQVKSVWLGIWGYAVVANTRLGGVREVIYDPIP